MLLAFVVGHGSSVAAAICQHQDIGKHVAARDGDDRQAASAALSEEAAAQTAAGKGAPSDPGPIAGATDLLPQRSLVVPLRLLEPLRSPLPQGPPLIGTSRRPLLEPPLA